VPDPIPSPAKEKTAPTTVRPSLRQSRGRSRSDDEEGVAVFEALIMFLKAKYQLKPMKTVPRGLTSIKYP
jgi:hypothetical protein